MSDTSIIAKFGMDATGLKNELKSIGRSVGDFANTASAFVGAGLTTALVATGVAALALGKSIRDMSLDLNIGAAAYQALQFQAEENGVSQEKFNMALKKVKESVISAAEGNNKLSDAFSDLGLNVESLMAMPLDKQYAAIASAVTNATDQSSAYNDVVQIFGSRVGPNMMESLRELAQEGLPAVIAQATKAGEVMSNETIVGLTKASQAIDKFKREAEIALGNILVDFRSEAGLKVLYDRFRLVVSEFGSGIGNAINDAAGIAKAVFVGTFDGVCVNLQNGLIHAFIAAIDVFNKVMPKSMEISTKFLNSRIDNNSGIGDHINEQIAQTQKSDIGKDDKAYWENQIKGDQAAATAETDKDFAKDVKQLEGAGKELYQSMADGSQKIIEGATEAAKVITTATNGLIAGIRGGSTFNSASDSAIKQIIEKNNEAIHALQNDSNQFLKLANSIEIARRESENQNAQSQLDTRNKIRQGYANGGGIQGAYNATPNIDPIMVDKIVQQMNLTNASTGKQTNDILLRLETGLTQSGLLGSTG